MKTTTVNWGIVGCGWVARDYVAPGMLNAPNTRLIALCDPDDAAMRRIAVEASDAVCHTDLDAFLVTPGLDAVYVATPNHLHKPVVEAAAQAGKHVLSEKPMATNSADAERMVHACAAAGVQYGTAFDQRWHARHRRLRQLIAEGALGTITAVRIHYACWTPGDWKPDTDDGRHDNWRVDPQRAGGGAFIDLAPHGLDLSQWLVGEELIDVACFFQRRVFNYPVDDGAALIGQFANGALLSHNIAYNCPDTFPRRTLEVIGTKAMAIARNTMGQTPGGTLHLIAAADGTTTQVEIAPEDDVSPFQTQVRVFSQCLLDGVPFPFAPARDLHTMRLLEVAMASQARTGGYRLAGAG